MQDILIISFYAVLGFAFVILWIWMTGRMATKKRLNRIVQYLGGRFQDLTSKVSVKVLGSTGAKLGYHQESHSPFPKLEATILLLDRSNAFAMIYWKARHRTDQLQIRANFHDLPDVHIDLTTPTEKKRLDKSFIKKETTPKEIKVDYLKDQFYIASYTSDKARSYFQQAKFRKALQKIAPYLTRLSVERREPHLFLSVELVPEVIGSLEQFTRILGKTLPSKKAK